MLIYTMVFILTFSLLLLSTMVHNGLQKRVLAILPLIALMIITGTRYYMGGYDIYNYANTFKQAPYLGNFHLLHVLSTRRIIGSDIGYQLLNSIIKTLGFNFFGFTLIVAIFFYISVYIGLSKFTDNLNLVLLVLMYKTFLGLTFVYMRQCIAVGIFLLSIKYIYQSKPIKYFLLIFLASTIHFSAIFLFFCYFLKFIKITRRGLIVFSVIMASSFIISLMDINVLSFLGYFAKFFSGSAQEKINAVAGNNNLYQGRSSVLHLIEFIGLDTLLIINFDNIKLDEKKGLMIKLFLCTLPFYSLLANQAILSRVPFYFLLSYALIIDYISEDRRQAIKLLIYTIVALICFAGLFKFAASFDGGVMLNYRSILGNRLSIFR